MLDRYHHFYIAENALCHPGIEFLLHMDFPRCFIRYRASAALFANYDTFVADIADVQWMDGERPDEATQARILTDAWNFLVLDEQRLNDGLDAMENDIDNL